MVPDSYAEDHTRAPETGLEFGQPRMDFLPEKELWRLFRAARTARADELASMGIPHARARLQAAKEFAVYDLIEVNDQGEMRLHGLELPAPRPRSRKRRKRRRHYAPSRA